MSRCVPSYKGATEWYVNLDYTMFNLEEGWANYSDGGEANEWAHRDQKLQEWIDLWGPEQTLPRLGEDTVKWLVNERLGDGSSFDAVWEGLSLHHVCTSVGWLLILFSPLQ